jgi:DNA-binding transcriptional ArsR family regulator
VAAYIALMANAMRVRLIQLMIDGEQQVGILAESIGLSQSATSQHLSILKTAGLVVIRKDRRFRHYTIKPERAELMQRLIAVADEQATRLHGHPEQR